MTTKRFQAGLSDHQSTLSGTDTKDGDKHDGPVRISGHDTWVFDLDNTLYPARYDLFRQINSRITGFVARYLKISRNEACLIQKKYYAEYGTTLRGMMRNHAMKPEDFLDYVHDIDLSSLPEMPDLADAINRLPGRKYVFTNGSRRHAERITGHMGLSGVLDGCFAIEDSAYNPKPDRLSYDIFVERFAVKTEKAVFFEDLARNLAPAHLMGFATVLVQSGHASGVQGGQNGPAENRGDGTHHIHYVTDDLTRFLQSLTR